ncbi:MAG: HlyD family secretion protein, partial [Hyphomicrobiales bacterium]|nr:HlyD family secretion protein [Hyphomicrobiales bacterium]
ADIYGSQVRYTGHIVGFGAGTGAAFALLPAQNATGNWIKIVQRVPVRIAIDARQVAEHPLRVGLSMEVDVDVHDQSGPQLAAAEPRPAQARRVVTADSPDASQQLIRRIIAENLGRGRTPPGPAALRAAPGR